MRENDLARSMSTRSPSTGDDHVSRDVQDWLARAQVGFETAFLEALERPAQVASTLSRDERISAVRWPTLLERELLHLQLWVVRRMLAAARGQPGSPTADGRLLCLLPRYAVTTHLLRRAVPFAALGIDTWVAFPEATVAAEGRPATEALAASLRLEHRLHAHALDGRRALEQMPGVTVCVTGRMETLEAVCSSPTTDLRFGAAGRCAVIVAGSEEEARHMQAELVDDTPRQSCSRVGEVIVLPHGELAAALRRCHPSVVLCGPSVSISELDTAGYCALPCDIMGRVGDYTGFGRDPVYGWPGDYAL